jgi:hypothetical protein
MTRLPAFRQGSLPLSSRQVKSNVKTAAWFTFWRRFDQRCSKKSSATNLRVIRKFLPIDCSRQSVVHLNWLYFFISQNTGSVTVVRLSEFLCQFVNHITMCSCRCMYVTCCDLVYTHSEEYIGGHDISGYRCKSPVSTACNSDFVMSFRNGRIISSVCYKFIISDCNRRYLQKT